MSNRLVSKTSISKQIKINKRMKCFVRETIYKERMSKFILELLKISFRIDLYLSPDSYIYPFYPDQVSACHKMF